MNKDAQTARDLAAAGDWKVERQARFLTLERSAPGAQTVDPEQRTLRFSFSSENPVRRWFGDEVLSHQPGAADLSRLNDGAPLLFNHNPDDVIGVVEGANIEGGRGYGTVRFAKTPRADEMLGMVNDGILRNVSFAYEVTNFRDDTPDDAGDDIAPTFTATGWKAYELSLVTIPADNSVGVGRSDSGGASRAVVLEKPAAMAPQSMEIRTMTENTNTGATVDVAAITEAARAAEQARVREIEAMGQTPTYGLSRDDVARFVREGTSIEAVRGIVLERLSKTTTKPVADPTAGDYSDDDLRGFSVVRAIQARLSGDWSKAGRERAMMQNEAKAQGRSEVQGLLLPRSLPFYPDETHLRASPRGMQQRATYQVGTAVQGGNLVASNLLAADFIEVLRNVSVTAQLGARYLTGLVGKVQIPRQTAQASTYWVAESSAVTESEATFDQVTLSPKTLGALSKISRLMLLQSTPAIEMIVREDLVRVMALGIDAAVLNGTGASGQPLGIANTSGVGAVVGGTNGANVSFDNMVQLYSSPRIANAPQANLAFAFNAKVYGYLSTLKATTGTYLWMPEGGITVSPGDSIMGHPFAVSNQLPYNLTKGTSSGICSQIVFGNWQEVFVGSWGSLELLVNPYDSTGFTTGDVLIRALQTIDVGVRHAASFSVMSDALTPGF